MSGRKKGSMLLETVLTLPLLYVLIMAVLQIAHIWTARQVAIYAAYAATRATVSVPPEEAATTARSAAWQICSLLTLSTDAQSNTALKMENEQLSIDLANETFLKNSAGQAIGHAELTLHYKFPLIMPVVGTFFSDGTMTFDGNEVSYLEFKERCVLPMRYSTASFPRSWRTDIGGTKTL